MGASIPLEVEVGSGQNPSDQIISIPGSSLPSCGQPSLLQLLDRFLCRRQEHCKTHFCPSLCFLPRAKNSHSESKGQPHPKPSQAVTLAWLLHDRSCVREHVLLLTVRTKAIPKKGNSSVPWPRDGQTEWPGGACALTKESCMLPAHILPCCTTFWPFTVNQLGLRSWERGLSWF